MNKELYMALSVPEKEELQLDDQYKTELRVEHVARLLNLPHEIQLALPHMESPGEIDAHKLLTTFTLEHGEADFAKADEQSQDHLFVTPSSCAHSTPQSQKQNQVSLIRKPSRDRIVSRPWSGTRYSCAKKAVHTRPTVNAATKTFTEKFLS